MKEKHLFAIYFHQTSAKFSTTSTHPIIIADDALIYRINRILRLHQEDELILFDRENNAYVALQEIGKTQLIFRLIKFNKNRPTTPVIDALLPILKRDHLEQAVYELSSLGVNLIQLIKTKKMHPLANEKKELMRLQNIIIAAAEQSKNFLFPKLLLPIELIQATEKIEGEKLFFDPEGKSFFPYIATMYEKKLQKISILVGPEGGLTQEEKELISKAGFSSFRLTNTILTAHQAISLAAGIIKTLINIL